MTGTAETEAAEFGKISIYGTVIPTTAIYPHRISRTGYPRKKKSLKP